MKKFFIVASLAAMFVAAPIVIQAQDFLQPKSEQFLAQSRRVVFRSTQRLRCNKSGEEIWLYRDGSWKSYDNGVFRHKGEYRIEGSFITFLDDEGDEIGHGRIYLSGANVSRLEFGGDNYYPY